MAIIPQAFAQVAAPPVPAFIGGLPEPQNFGAKDNEWRDSIDPAKDVTNYLGRVHKKYSGMDTSNIEDLVNRLFQEQDQTFLNFVREETTLRNTFINRFFEAKTPLGDVLQELQNSQESPNRKLLSKEIFRQAEKEAEILIEIEEALTKLDGNPDGASVMRLSNDQFFVTWESKDQDSGLHAQLFNADGIKNGSEFRINTYTSNHHTTSLSDGSFKVTWEKGSQDDDVGGLYGQIF